MFIFRIENLMFSYNKKEQVLNIPSLKIESNKITCFLGPNGSGKTTLLKLLSTLLVLRDGKITRGKESNIYVLQQPYLFNMSVRKNLELGLRLKKIKKEEIEKRVLEGISVFMLENLVDKKASELSYGEIKRVAFAQCFVMKPSVLLIDEPTAGIDTASMTLLEKIVHVLRSKYNIDLVFTTHNLNFAYRVAEKIFLIDRGEIRDFSYDNFFYGKVFTKGEIFLFNIGPIDIQIPPIKEDVKAIAINPEDIIISHQKILSSARNSFCGAIESLCDRDGMIEITVNVGERLKGLITKDSYHELNLKVGEKVYTTFKVASVKLF